MTSNNRLYIIGNGFDLHHGLPTRFEDFRDFIRRQDFDSATACEQYLGELRGDWANLEASLEKMDSDGVREVCADSFPDYGSDDFKAADHTAYQECISSQIELISARLLEQFCEWLTSLDVPGQRPATKTRISIDPNATFLTFNYTPTLQQMYAVEDANITHIHGRREQGTDGIILGHAWRPNPLPEPQPDFDGHWPDPVATECEEILHSYFGSTFKDTAAIITTNRAAFDEMGKATEVFVLGHSISDVDLPYFEEIARQTKDANAKWTVSCYDDSKRVEQLQQVAKAGVNPDQVTQIRLEELLEPGQTTLS